MQELCLRWEVMGCKDHARAWLRRHGIGYGTTIAARHTLIAKTSMVLSGACWATNSHSKALI